MKLLFRLLEYDPQNGLANYQLIMAKLMGSLQ